MNKITDMFQYNSDFSHLFGKFFLITLDTCIKYCFENGTTRRPFYEVHSRILLFF